MLSTTGWSACATMAGPRPERASRRSKRSCASRRKIPRPVVRMQLGSLCPHGGATERGAGVPIFLYKAADQRGQTIDGVMEAADARSVVERLQHDAYFPIQVRPQEERAGFAGLTWPALWQRHVAGRELVAFTQQLATLLEAGLPLDRALAIQEELTPNPRLRAITAHVLR